jgi:hypothetical protein
LTDKDHLRVEEYLGSARQGVNHLALLTHAHLVRICSRCAAVWDALGPLLRNLYRDHLARTPTWVPPRLPERDELSGQPEVIEALAAQSAALRRLRRCAKKQLSELRTLPAEARADRIRGAYRRFRTRQLAELLVEESRRVIRDAPTEAQSYASLVPLVLDWARGPDAPPWADALLVRAAAHRANALRVSGDVNAADRSWRHLHAGLDQRPLIDPSGLAEIASLEASLRLDQRHFGHAEELLGRADQAFRYLGDRGGLARIRIKQANLKRVQGHPEQVVHLLDEASELLGTDTTPYLTICTVTGRVNALCDLGRPTEARRLLRRHLDAFEADPGPHAAALLRCLEGRAALGLGELAAAADYFQTSHDAMLAAGRPYDAAVHALFLAETYLEQGRIQDLRVLATRLLFEFRSRGIAGESLAALKLLVQAIAAETVTRALVVELRERFAGAQPRSSEGFL